MAERLCLDSRHDTPCRYDLCKACQDECTDPDGLASLIPERIVVTAEAYDALVEMLDNPPPMDPERAQRLRDLLTRPSVFDA